MKPISAWQGDTISLTVNAPDDTATQATLLVGTLGAEAIFTKTVPFTDGVADLTILDSENVIPAGAYNYMVEVDYSDGSTRTFPKPDSRGGAEVAKTLPDFNISERITEGV